MATILQIKEEILSEFEFFGDNWEQKYEYLISYGAHLPQIAQEDKIEENLVKGCISNMWLKAELKRGQVLYTAESESLMVRGIAALLLRIFNNQSVEDIIHAELDFIDTLQLKKFLSMNRSNGLYAMLKQIKTYALAFKIKIDHQV